MAVRACAWLMFVCCCVPSAPVVLTLTNHLSIRGPIEASTATTFVHDSQLHHSTVRYVYIHSPGGSVSAGEQMVEEMRQRNYTCIADMAYSMAFSLFQACSRRYVRPSASLMQHSISLTNVGGGELGKVLARLQHIERTRQRLDTMQAQRLKLTEAQFVERTHNEWWLDAQEAVDNHCADGIVRSLTCSPKLLKSTVARTDTRVAGIFATAVVNEYSSCPLVHEPLRVLASASAPVIGNNGSCICPDKSDSHVHRAHLRGTLLDTVVNAIQSVPRVGGNLDLVGKI